MLVEITVENIVIHKATCSAIGEQKIVPGDASVAISIKYGNENWKINFANRPFTDLNSLLSEVKVELQRLGAELSEAARFPIV